MFLTHITHCIPQSHTARMAPSPLLPEDQSSLLFKFADLKRPTTCTNIFGTRTFLRKRKVNSVMFCQWKAKSLNILMGTLVSSLMTIYTRKLKLVYMICVCVCVCIVPNHYDLTYVFSTTPEGITMLSKLI